jgi:predicted HicB family RNase H-like nuclease
VKKSRSYNLQIRLSAAEHDALVKRAAKAGMSQCEYVRLLIRRARIRVSVEA